MPKKDDKVTKYYLAKKAGMTGKLACEVAGYRGNGSQVGRIEKTAGYRALQVYYKDALQEEISVADIAKEHAKVIRQDAELGPKIASIKMAYDKIEPEPPKEENDDDKVFVVLR